jgi:hypothetical protein
MQKYFLLAVLFLSCYGTNAQSPISLSKSNVPQLSPGVLHYRVANISGVNAPSTGTNQNWDYSFIKGSPVKNTAYLPAASFSSTAVMDTNGLEIIYGTFGLNAGIVYDMDANGLFITGGVVKKQTFPLGAATGNAKDSIYVGAQFYKLRDDIIDFPVSASSHWVSNSMHSLNFNVSANGLVKAPARKLSYKRVVDSVKGWGAVTIPSPRKSSIPYDVLLVRRKTITIDSFYLFGVAAPAALLSSFGIKQGDTGLSFTELFYRTGSPVPLLSFDFGTDSTYSSPSGATYDADNVQSGVMPEGYDFSTFNIFPNPAHADGVNVRLYKPSSGQWIFMVVNQIGQTLKILPVEGTGNLNFEIGLSGMLPGLYYVRVTDNQGQVFYSSKLDIVK